MELGPRYGTYALRFFLTNPQVDDPTDSAVRAHVLASLERKGMKLGVPYQEELQIKDNEAHRQEAAERELERHKRVVDHCEIFGGLSGEERTQVAERLVNAPFVKGDTITRQGDVAHWLYIIDSGTAEVVVETPSGRQPIATLMGGSVFGEMGMMTGEPRRATVIAKSDVECYRLDKEGFESVLRARPDVAEHISAVLANRESELETALETSANGKAHRPGREQILERIRDFFGLDR